MSRIGWIVKGAARKWFGFVVYKTRAAAIEAAKDYGLRANSVQAVYVR